MSRYFIDRPIFAWVLAILTMLFGLLAIRTLPIAQFPALAPPQIAGLINIRGEIVTAFDLREVLGRPQREKDQRPMNVIVTTEHGRVSMLVDAVSDVLELDDDAFEPPPSTLRGVGRDVILGAYKLDGGLLLELDLDAAIGTTSPSGIDAEVDDR